jgi:hypothetical protein
MHSILGGACADDESAFLSLPFRNSISLQQYLGECAHLRSFAAVFACRRAFPENNDATIILNEFYAVMSDDPGFIDSSIRLKQEATERAQAYFEALQVRAGGDAMLRLGKAFAGFFSGQSDNLHLALLGTSMFGNCAKHTEPALRRFRIAQ